MTPAATIPLPEVRKTRVQLLIESRDPRRRDIREIVREAYNRTRRLEDVAAELSGLAGRDEQVSIGTLSLWVRGWGWSLDRVLTIPTEAR